MYLYKQYTRENIVCKHFHAVLFFYRICTYVVRTHGISIKNIIWNIFFEKYRNFLLMIKFLISIQIQFHAIQKQFEILWNFTLFLIKKKRRRKIEKTSCFVQAYSMYNVNSLYVEFFPRIRSYFLFFNFILFQNFVSV